MRTILELVGLTTLVFAAALALKLGAAEWERREAAARPVLASCPIVRESTELPAYDAVVTVYSQRPACVWL